MKTLKKLFQAIRSRLPSALPRGSAEFDLFADSIISLYNLPDKPSYRNAIASMIMHLGPTTCSKSKYYFGRSILKAMSNQVAYEKIQQFKKAEDEAMKAAEQVDTSANDSKG